MANRLLKLIATFLILIYGGFYSQAKPQEIAFDNLEKYLNEQRASPESIQIIKQHLVESGADDPLNELVAWAKAGFPDLHDKSGIWKTESLSLKLGVVTSIHYYFTTSPPENRSARYLEIINELRSDDYISEQLIYIACSVVDESVLEKEVLELLSQENPKLRAQGVLMGRALAEKERPLFERYIEMLNHDDDAQVRVTILYSIGSWRRKDVAYLALGRLVNDTSPDVRDWGARILRIAAQLRVITEEDLPAVLAPLLKTEEPFVRVSIARAVCLMTTDPSLGVEEDKITDELLAGFIKRARLRESKTGISLSEKELAELWLNWWTPLIPKYTKPMQVVK